MSETRDTIAQWADETFGVATDGARIARALEELREIYDAEGPRDTLEEVADVTICLCACPSMAGVDVAAIVGPGVWLAVEHKMKINRARKWVRRGDGCGDHIKGDA